MSGDEASFSFEIPDSLREEFKTKNVEDVIKSARLNRLNDSGEDDIPF